jgi:DNA-binding NtrC family response regulator
MLPGVPTLRESGPPTSPDLVGESLAMQALRREIVALAPYDVSVLIRGESGTGKALIARALHAKSPRASAPFVPVDCATLRGDLLLSHLFGHERGAFPGAGERRAGVIREAEGGTVFLDEVGELAPEAQGALLRVLEAGEIHAVGGARPIHVDVRVLAATHRDLPAWVTAERFREDLFYRLREAVIAVPPLRDRPEDLPLLVEHLRVTLNAQRGLAVEGIRPATLARLAAEPWPGNVRQLRAVLAEAMAERQRGWLEPEDLSFAAMPGVVGTRSNGAAVAPMDMLPASSADARRGLARRLAARPGGVTRRQLARAVGVSGNVAWQLLAALAAEGALRREGAGRGVRYVVR